MVKDLTQGSPIRRILAFCTPILIGYVFQQFYNMADSIIVGQYIGVSAFAAVGATGSLNFFVIGFATGVCSGFAIPVAQDFGANDMNTMRKSVAHAMYWAAIIAVVATIATYLLTRPILVLLQTPSDIIDDSYRYISIIFAGIGATMLYNFLSCILRALGDSRTPLIFLGIASVINVALDLLFIAYLRLGIAGAAYATVISQLISGVLCLLFIISKFPMLHLKKADMKYSGAVSRRILFIGIPMGLQFSITAVGSIILQSAVNGLGSTVVAAMSASGKVYMLVVSPMDCLGVTMATYCGQNFGARRIDRVHQGVRQVTLVSFLYCLVAYVVSVYLGETIAMLFIDAAETTLLSYVHQALQVYACFYPMLALIFILRNSLQGLGYSNSAMLAGLFELVGRSGVAFSLVGRFGFFGVCLANPIAWIAADVLLIPLYFIKMHKLDRQYPLPQA